jgi:predicted ATP-grasp superfamily ATP-dependent carboligase
LLIFGASTRAAAFSALRAGLSPWCIDLFADADVQARCPVQAISSDQYPQGFAKVQTPEAPWIYTGGLENYPALVSRLARSRTLWGNGEAVLRSVRSPAKLNRLLRANDVPCPLTRMRPPDPLHGRWLVKPVAGSGGAGIHFWTGQPIKYKKRIYYQQFVEGDPYSAIYLAEQGGASLWGVSRQLIGEPWLHARPFQYCGTLSQPRDTPMVNHLDRLGTVLTEATDLCGLFGVDFILRDDAAWPIEVNPRYTASMEVVELAQGVPLLAEHCRVFDPRLAARLGERSLKLAAKRGTETIGKAILFARETLTFPADGPWMKILRNPPGLWDVPCYADLPHISERIETGQPVLTFFAEAESPSRCRGLLQEIAQDLDRWLYRR